MKLFAYLKSRLGERSTWMLIAAGVTGAAALVWPWSAVFFVASLIGAMVPDGKPKA